MSDQMQTESATLASSLHALKHGLFGTLFVAQRKTHSAPVASVIGIAIKWLQIMAFLFIPSSFLWRKDTIAPLKFLTLVPSPAGWFKIMDGLSNNIIFFISLAWVIAFVGLMGWAMRNFLKGEIPHLWPLHLLSAIGSFSATVAYIPLVTILLSVFMCNKDDPNDLWAKSYECWGAAHLALVIISSVFATVFIGLASLFAVVFYDSHPLSSNLAAKVHGRADLIMLIVKTVLILTIEIFPRFMGGEWSMIAINVVAAAVWVAVLYAYMPMTHHAMNALQLSLACLYLFGGISLVIAQSMPHVDAAIILYVGAPTAVLVGVGLANFRRSHVMTMSISKMWSTYEVEMRARFMLQAALNHLLEVSVAVAAKIEFSGTADQDEETGVPAKGKGLSAMASPRSPRSIVKSRDSKSRRSAMDTDLAEVGLFAASYKSMETEARTGLLKNRMPSKTIAEVEALYKAAVVRFPTSAVLHMFHSRFYSTFTEEKHLSTSHLLLANRLNPALDVAFLAYQARRAAENGSGAGVLSSAMHRVSFDKHLADARTSTMKAAQAQVAFWQELADSKPDINLLHSIATDLANHTIWAEEHFKEVFALHPQSLSAMRLFAQYNLSVANNPEKAAAIIAEADRIEDQKNREQSQNGNTTGTQFVMFDETSAETMTDAPAVVTVGATSRDLGIILQANAAACKLLGYTRLQLERRSLSIIVPSPFAESHEGYMRRYLSTGEGRLLETARIMLAKHRQGHLVPLVMLSRETTLPDGTPIFSAALRPLNFNDHLVMMDEDWVIQGGTAGALMGLGVEPATLATSEVSMADYCSFLTDPQMVDELAAKPNGDVVTIRLPGHTANADAGSEGSGGAPQRSSAGMELQSVKATLHTSIVKGFAISVLSWRTLSVNEASQRRNSIIARTESSKMLRSGSVGKIGEAGLSSALAGQSTGEGAGMPRRAMSMALRAAGGNNHGVSFRETPREYTARRDSLGQGQAAAGTGDAMNGARTPAARSITGEPGSRSEEEEEEEEQASVDSSLDNRSTDSNGKQGRRASGSRGEEGSSEQQDADTFSANPLRASHSLPAGHPPALLSGLLDSCPVMKKGDGVDKDCAPGAAGTGADARAGREAWKPIEGLRGQNRRTSKASDAADDSAAGAGKGALRVPDSTEGGETPNGNRRGSVGDDGTRSVGKASSHGSSSKRSSVGRATLNKLRRILADTRGAGATKGVPGLSALYITGWMLFILNLVLGIMSATLLDSNFAKYADNLKFASVAGRTTQAQVRAMRLVCQRALWNRGWIQSSPEIEQQYSKEMAEMADFYSTASSRMYDLVAGTERAGFFTDPTLEYADFTDVVPEPPGRVTDYAIKAMLLGNVYWPRSLSTGEVLVGRRRRTSLLDFSSMWAGMLKQYANLPIKNCTNDHPFTLFIATNTQAGAPAHVKIKKAIYESYLASEDSQKTVTTLVLWIFVAMGPILASVILLIVIPILLFIDRSRDDVMERFLDLPNLVTAVLRSQAEKRLKALRSDDDDGDTDDEGEEEDEARRLMMNGDLSITDGGGTLVEGADGTVDWDALFARATVEANRAKAKSKAIAAQAAAISVGMAGVGTEGAAGTVATASSGRPHASRGCCGRTQQHGPVIYAGRTFCSRGKRAPGGGYWRSVVNPDGTVSNFVRRDFRKSSKSMVSLSAVFLLPVLLMFLFYLVLYLVTMDTLERVIAMSAFTSLSALRGAALEASVGALFNMVTQTGYSPEEAFRYEFTAQEVVNLRAINELLVYDNRVWQAEESTDGGIAPPMQYKKGPGSETSMVPGMNVEKMGVITQAMMKNGCKFVGMTSDGQQDATKCAEFNGAVFTSGLQAGLKDYINRNRRLRDRRWATDMAANSTTGIGIRRIETSSIWGKAIAGKTVRDTEEGITTSTPGGLYPTQIQELADTIASTGQQAWPAAGHDGTVSLADPSLNDTVVTWTKYDVKAELTGEDWRVSDAMVRDYLSPAFLLTAQWYSDAGEAIVVEYRTFLMAFVIAFLAVFSTGIFALYLPAITSLARDVQSKRAMLLLLPAQVTAKVPSIRALVIQIVAEHEGGGNTSSVQNAGKSFAGEGSEEQPAQSAPQAQAAAKA